MDRCVDRCVDRRMNRRPDRCAAPRLAHHGGALALAFGLAWPLAAPAQGAAPQGAAAGLEAPVAGLRPELVSIPVPGAGSFGRDAAMRTQVFRPDGPGPFPVLVFSHGRSGDPQVRARLARPVSPGQLRYWHARGWAVVAPLRPGYGETGGPDAENSGAVFAEPGVCRTRPSYARTADAGARAVLATVDWVRRQPWAQGQRIVLEGQSLGGLATVAAAARHPPGVVAYINFAGGAGGSPQRSPGRNCAPEILTEVYGALGRSTTVPNLWIYAQNDQYFGADAPRDWHAAFAAGGSPTRFEQAPPMADGDGHGLSRHAPEHWAPYLDRFLRSLGD